ncbi:MAG: hypothetical protein II748_05245 [Clostridia bacterium]|nr:hypothetical protein [Clostridia bacterium]
MELSKNVAWVRRVRPVIKPDGVFAQTITMNPCPYVENGTIYLFYAGDNPGGKRQVRLATAPLSDPENFTFRGIMLENAEEPGRFDYAWNVLPHVVKLPDGTYYMLFTGNCGAGKTLASFPGIGCAFSDDLLHWRKYSGNPVMTADGETDGGLVGLAGGGLFVEPLEGNGYKLHFYYTACPTAGDNVFLDQQKKCNYATSTDGIHWTKHGTVHRRSTARDYENIASTGGPVLRDSDGLLMHWYSAIGSRFGIYSICYAESTDGIHWNKGERNGDNLSLGPCLRDTTLWHLGRNDRWENDSVSYPGVIKAGDSFRLFYSGNDYGEGGIGTAVSSPLKVAGGDAPEGLVRVWKLSKPGVVKMRCCAAINTDQYGRTVPTFQEESVSSSSTLIIEDGIGSAETSPLLVRFVFLHKDDGVEVTVMAENRTSERITGLCVEWQDLADLTLEGQDGTVLTDSDKALVKLPDICPYGTVSRVVKLKA